MNPPRFLALACWFIVRTALRRRLLTLCLGLGEEVRQEVDGHGEEDGRVLFRADAR